MYSIFFSKINVSFILIEERLKQIINKEDKVVIIPWSFAKETDALGLEKYFSGQKRDKYVNSLLKLGINEDNISIINCYNNTSDEMINKINESNILVLPGGNPEMFYEKVKICGLLETIKNYDKIIIGESAGTELQLNNYFITAKNNYYKKFEWYKGFNVIDNSFYIDVHTSNNYKYLNKLQNVANETQKKVYAIYDDGAIIFNRKTNNVEIFGNVKIILPRLNIN